MITREQIELWLKGIASGVIVLDRDNEGMARATLSALSLSSEPASALPEGYLSPHFTLAELIHSDTANAKGIDNTPDAAAEMNLAVLASVLEEIRHVCGDHPVTISSGYRCDALNRAVGGVSDSAHRYGLAADIVIPECGDPLHVAQLIEPHMADWHIDQLINEEGGGGRWVHVGVAAPGEVPRCQAMSMHGGTYTTGLA